MFSLTALVVLGLCTGAVPPPVVRVVEVKKCGSLNEEEADLNELKNCSLFQEGGRTARVHPLSCSITVSRVLGVDYCCASNSPAVIITCNLTATKVICHANLDLMSESLPPVQDPRGFLYAIQANH